MTEEGEIVQVRLISGDELICTVVSHDESAFMVHSMLHMIPFGELDILEEMESYILRPYVTYTANLDQTLSLTLGLTLPLTLPSGPDLGLEPHGEHRDVPHRAWA